MSKTEAERNSIGVRVKDENMLNVWTHHRLGFPSNQDWFHESIGYSFVGIACEFLRQGLAYQELSAHVADLECIDKNGWNRWMFNFGEGEYHDVTISLKKPFYQEDKLSGIGAKREGLTIEAEAFIRHGEHFMIFTKDGTVYTDYWQEMSREYQHLAKNIVFENAIDKFTRKENFPSNEGPVSMYELAAKAFREDKKIVTHADISTIEMRVDGTWQPIAPEDIVPGMDVRFGRDLAAINDITAVEYRDGQLTLITPNKIFCNNAGLEGAFWDLLDNVRRESRKEYTNDEWRQMLDAHVQRVDTLAERFEQVADRIQCKEFEPEDLDRDKEYSDPLYLPYL